MERKIDPVKLLAFHEEIAIKHRSINGFYRFNFNEIEGQFRSGVQTPALIMMSQSNSLSSNTNKVSNFNTHNMSILIIDFGGSPNDFDKENEVLNKTYYLAMDVVSYLVKQNQTTDSFLHMLFEVDSVRIEKVGPLFDNMFGWNLLYNLKNKEPFCFEADKWNM